MGAVLGVDLAARFARVRICDGLREQTLTDRFAGAVPVASAACRITLRREEGDGKKTKKAKQTKQKYK